MAPPPRSRGRYRFQWFGGSILFAPPVHPRYALFSLRFACHATEETAPSRKCAALSSERTREAENRTDFLKKKSKRRSWWWKKKEKRRIYLFRLFLFSPPAFAGFQ